MDGITEKDLEGINTFDIPYHLDEEYGIIEIDLPYVDISIQKRNTYCDRGRYGVHCSSKVGLEPPVIHVDGQDGFPRYFFKLQNLFNELHEWIEFRFQRIKSGQ